jgi:ATP-dependent exoDNAse (exonuclease V) alpha subunit
MIKDELQACMDRFMADISGQTIVETTRVIDFCLDLRLIAAKLEDERLPEPV